MINHTLRKQLITISVLLFLLQSLRVAFSTLFGIIYDQIFEGPTTVFLGISVGALLLVFLLPVFIPREPSRKWMIFPGGAVALARVAFNINDAPVRFWSSLVVLGGAVVFLGYHLCRRRERLFQLFLIALIVDQILRTVGYTFDLSLRESWLPVQVVWTLLMLYFLYTEYAETGEPQLDAEGMSPWTGVALGSYLFLETSILGLANGTARWSETPYPIHAVVSIALTFLFLFPAFGRRLRERIWDHPFGPLAVSVILIGGVLYGYFYAGLLAMVALLLSRIASLILLAGLLWGERASRWRAGTSLALGMAGFMVLNFLNAFAFTYPYTLPGLRDMGWAMYLAAMFLVMIGNLVERPFIPMTVEQPQVGGRVIMAGLATLAIAIVFVWPWPTGSLGKEGVIRAATWNIHYGYDEPWHLTLEEQARAIAAADIDVLFLQEVDTGRMTSYAIDDAYFLARTLRMNQAYLPTVEGLTGIAVLYRGSTVHPNQQLLSSLQEQTGILQVDLELEKRDLASYGIWLGLSNEDTGRQIQEALDFIDNKSPAIFGGDFNAEIGSPVIEAIHSAGFVDPCEILGSIQDPERIDFVWIRGMLPSRCWLSDSMASDHFMVVIELAPLDIP